jgi:hypothetical protein
MKKIITSVLVASLATILFSCQKEKDLPFPASGKAANQGNAGKIVPTPPVSVPFTLSNWFAVPLSNVMGNGDLYGNYVLNTPSTGTSDQTVKIAYVRRSGTGIASPNDGFKYSRLPAIVNTSQGHQANMNFNLSAVLFEIFVTPIGIIPILLDPNDFKDCNYRYIIISQVDYNGLNVDWNDYKAVASFLNFTP